MSDAVEIVRSAMNDDGISLSSVVDAMLKDRIIDRLADKQEEIMQRLYGDAPEDEEGLETDDEVVIDIPDLEDDAAEVE